MPNPIVQDLQKELKLFSDHHHQLSQEKQASYIGVSSGSFTKASSPQLLFAQVQKLLYDLLELLQHK